jgi:hypothetical protein
MKKSIVCVIFSTIFTVKGVSGCDANLLESRTEMFLKRVSAGEVTDETTLKKELNFVTSADRYAASEVHTQCIEAEADIRQIPEIVGEDLNSQEVGALNSFLGAARSINNDTACSLAVRVALCLILERFITKLTVFLSERKNTSYILSTWREQASK